MTIRIREIWDINEATSSKVRQKTFRGTQRSHRIDRQADEEVVWYQADKLNADDFVLGPEFRCGSYWRRKKFELPMAAPAMRTATDA
jgi:hypothetical protein